MFAAQVEPRREVFNGGPASRFSKTVATGMRAPRKTQAPLTFSGELSTAGHCDQSSADMNSLLAHRTPFCRVPKGRVQTIKNAA